MLIRGPVGNRNFGSDVSKSNNGLASLDRSKKNIPPADVIYMISSCADHNKKHPCNIYNFFKNPHVSEPISGRIRGALGNRNFGSDVSRSNNGLNFQGRSEIYLKIHDILYNFLKNSHVLLEHDYSAINSVFDREGISDEDPVKYVKLGSSRVFVYEEGGEFYNSLLQASLDYPGVFKDVLNTEIKNTEFVVNRHCFHISKRVASYMDLNMLRAVKSIFGLSK
ncbi:MAG: hypothetical protein CMP21_04800 [Rickettsiales bacterium]|nr:hypothetical protein [Rickettsiales bacterium]